MARFPYVNGGLFAERLTLPDFDAPLRAALIDACQFDWAAISRAIFGALFPSVMEPAELRARGPHYTTETKTTRNRPDRKGGRSPLSALAFLWLMARFRSGSERMSRPESATVQSRRRLTRPHLHTYK